MQVGNKKLCLQVTRTTKKQFVDPEFWFSSLNWLRDLPVAAENRFSSAIDSACPRQVKKSIELVVQESDVDCYGELVFLADEPHLAA